MNFKEATDALFSRVDHEELAKKLGVSIASIRQARLRTDAKAHRDPPANWMDAVVRLSEMQIMHHRQLIEAVKKQRENRQ